MKSIINYLLALVLSIYAQNLFASECDIPMRIIIDKDFSHITDEAASVLETQLQRMATQSKLNIGWDNANFALTAKFDQVGRFVVDGAPAQIVNVYGVTLFIIDIYNQKLFASTYSEIKGVGTNETKSTLNAIKQLNLRNTSISKFLSEAKNKITGYYDSQLPRIITEAKAKCGFKEYGAALSMLSVVPSCCKGYDEAMREAKSIYLLYRDTYFQAQVNKAKALWASNPTVEGSKEVVAILAVVDPEASAYPEAMELLSEVAKVVKTDVDYEVKKKYEDAVELEKLRIQAIAAIGNAYAANQPKVNLIFLEKGGHNHHGGVPYSSGETENATGIESLNMQPSETIPSGTKMEGAEIFKRYGSAVFTIYLPAQELGKQYQGSGFFINGQGLAVTNYHVLKDGVLAKAQIKIPGTNTSYGIKEILKSNQENDYVVFTVNCEGNNFIPMASVRPNVGEKVFAIGSPKGFENTFSSGEISQWRDRNRMQTTVMIDHGSSGGALISEYGEVVGITSGTFDSESVANLNYAVSIDVIR